MEYSYTTANTGFQAPLAAYRQYPPSYPHYYNYQHPYGGYYYQPRNVWKAPCQDFPYYHSTDPEEANYFVQEEKARNLAYQAGQYTQPMAYCNCSQCYNANSEAANLFAQVGKN